MDKPELIAEKLISYSKKKYGARAPKQSLFHLWKSKSFQICVIKTGNWMKAKI